MAGRKKMAVLGIPLAMAERLTRIVVGRVPAGTHTRRQDSNTRPANKRTAWIQVLASFIYVLLKDL